MDDWAHVGQDGPKPGDVIGGKYEILRLVGRGGMGFVYEARHAALGRPLAIKFLRADVADERDVIERFFREARSAAAIAHPRIVDVFDVGWTDDGQLPWFAMELLEGRSLAEELNKAGAKGMLAVRAASVACQVLDALEAAHAHRIIHRDLKPENVFLIRHGLEDDIKVLDFGISKVIDKRITVTGVILGTPAYMSPEQAKGSRDIDHRADIYAAGAMLFEMLAGQPPFQGSSYHQILLAIMTAERPTLLSLRPALHPSLAAVTERALAKDPGDRWPTAAAMRDALMEVVDSIDQLIAEGQESSMPSDTKTHAWVPTPRPTAAEPAPAAMAEQPAVEVSAADCDDEAPTAGAQASRPSRLSRGPTASPAAGPTPLLAHVRPAIVGEPTVVRPRRGWVLPALLFAGLLLAGAAAAAYVFLVAL